MALMKTPTRSYAEDISRALDPSVRGAELVVLAAHRDLGVRAAVASRPDAPMGSLIALAHESDGRILSALVDNPTSPPWVIRFLVNGRSSDIAERALARLRVMDAHAQLNA